LVNAVRTLGPCEAGSHAERTPVRPTPRPRSPHHTRRTTRHRLAIGGNRSMLCSAGSLAAACATLLGRARVGTGHAPESFWLYDSQAIASCVTCPPWTLTIAYGDPSWFQTVYSPADTVGNTAA